MDTLEHMKGNDHVTGVVASYASVAWPVTYSLVTKWDQCEHRELGLPALGILAEASFDPWIRTVASLEIVPYNGEPEENYRSFSFASALVCFETKPVNKSHSTINNINDLNIRTISIIPPLKNATQRRWLYIMYSHSAKVYNIDIYNQERYEGELLPLFVKDRLQKSPQLISNSSPKQVCV